MAPGIFHLKEKFEKIRATSDYRQANYLKAEATLKLIRMRVREKYGGEPVERIPDQLPAPPEKDMKDQRSAIKGNTVAHGRRSENKTAVFRRSSRVRFCLHRTWPGPWR